MPADFIPPRVCILICEIILTLPHLEDSVRIIIDCLLLTKKMQRPHVSECRKFRFTQRKLSQKGSRRGGLGLHIFFVLIKQRVHIC